MSDFIPTEQTEKDQKDSNIIKISGMFENWWVDYASYTILDRAIPSLEDGFKPVQRRIMHSLKELEDGRYNKVANVVGNTMKYHPHGDKSIADALIQIGQKDLLIDMQGNWGNIFTGDVAAAPRYIEARLSKFALEVIYSPKVTNWQKSYDGRNNEPIHLPVKFPLLLAQGTEGIAVGLSTKILPHNFTELIDASVKYLEGKSFELYPDFPTGGIIDVSKYNDGERGGKIRVRARVSQKDKSTLVISEIPFSTTTSSLIKSILDASEKGKIKIKKVEDNTSENVEVLIHLPAGVSPDKTIDALYAFTACEVSISPICCVIEQNNRPLFTSVSDLLKRSTDNTLNILKKELEIQLDEEQRKWHFASLERIFIENRIYRKIEEEKTWEGIILTIDTELKPFIGHLKRAVTHEDIARLTEIPIKRISRYDLDKAQQYIESLEEKIAEIQKNLQQLVPFTIDFFKRLKETYGKNKKRLTEIRTFDDIEASKVVIRNLKLYVNKEEGFIGTSLKKDEYVCDCSDIDDVIVFTQEGKMIITKVSEKSYIGKNIIYANVFKKNDKRTIYNMVYFNGNDKISYIKRFNVTGIIRDKEYEIIEANKTSAILYFSANPNGEAEIISVQLRPLGSVKKLKWDINFADILIKGRASRGNIVSKFTIKKIELKEKGVSTLKPRQIWFDPIVQRLNTDQRGKLLGRFSGEDRLLLIYANGLVKTAIPDLSLHFEPNLLVIEKWNPEKPISVIHYEGEKKRYFVKRFLIENPNREEVVISENPKSQMVFVSTENQPVVNISFAKSGKISLEDLQVNLEEFISVKGIKAIGNQLTTEKIKNITEIVQPKEEILEDVDNQEDTQEQQKDNEPTLFD